MVGVQRVLPDKPFPAPEKMPGFQGVIILIPGVVFKMIKIG